VALLESCTSSHGSLLLMPTHMAEVSMIVEMIAPDGTVDSIKHCAPEVGETMSFLQMKE
jgi:hypothetical protein